MTPNLLSLRVEKDTFISPVRRSKVVLSSITTLTLVINLTLTVVSILALTLAFILSLIMDIIVAKFLRNILDFIITINFSKKISISIVEE